MHRHNICSLGQISPVTFDLPLGRVGVIFDSFEGGELVFVHCEPLAGGTQCVDPVKVCSQYIFHCSLPISAPSCIIIQTAGAELDGMRR